jgi:hypothetical protein
MRMHRLATLTAAALVTAALPALAGAGWLAPALAQQAARGSGGPPPPPGGGSYTHAVYSQVHITGDTVSGGAVSSQYQGPPCWLEPRFPGSNSWHRGDPVVYTPNGDADEYWWWFSTQEPSFAPTAHSPGAAGLINRSFKQHQGGSGWWWVPSWLQSSGGMACALGLVSSLGLNNGFLDYTPPAVPAHGDNPGTIDGKILADLARAALALPGIAVHTNPMAPVHPSDVNLPLWVWVTYRGARNPSDTASVPLPGGGALSATVRTSQPALSLSVSTGSAQVYRHCGATGSRYPGGAAGLPPCGVTFLAPSTRGPFTLTVTARWTVTWSDSTGAHGGFASPPWPLPMKTEATLVTVREIQAVNTPPPAP